MIKLIERLIYLIKMELNWRKRTIDAPKAFPIQQNESSIEGKSDYPN